MHHRGTITVIFHYFIRSLTEAHLSFLSFLSGFQLLQYLHPVRAEVELSVRLPLKSSDDVEACIGMNALFQSRERENENEGERESKCT